MAPMFCTKIFNWGKGKKEGSPSSGGIKGTKVSLDAVYPKQQEDGELCPYWTHIQCQQIYPKAPYSGQPQVSITPTTVPPPPTCPPPPAPHQGTLFQNTATVRSPAAIRRGHHRIPSRSRHEVVCTSPHSSPLQSPFTSPIHQSHHGRQSPHFYTHAGRESPLLQSGTPKSPTLSTHSGLCHSSSRNNFQHTGGRQSPLVLLQGAHSQHPALQSSPVQQCSYSSSYGSLHRMATLPQSPRRNNSAPQSPVHRGYVLEANYVAPYPAPSHPPPPPPPQRPPPPIPEEGTQVKGAPSSSSSRSASPANGSASFIPTPRGHGASRSSAADKHKSGGSSGSGRSSLRNSSGIGHQVSANNNHYSHGTSSPKNKDSMLDKLKLFNSKEKEQKSKNSSSSGVSKRTSSSSGFSSARSERSDSSSASICSEARPPPLPPHQSLPAGSTTSSSSSEQAPTPIAATEANSTSGKSPGLKGIRSRFTRSSKDGKESTPKSSRRSEDRETSKSSPRSSHRSHRSGDSRDREREKERDKESRSENRSHEPRGTEKLTLDLDTSNRCVSPLNPDQAKVTSKIASIATSKHAGTKDQQHLLHVQQAKSPTMPQSSSAPGTPISPLSSSSIGSTGIPKPTAAVKGTTKVVTDCTSPSSPNVNIPTPSKEYHNKMARSSSINAQRRNASGGESSSYTSSESKDIGQVKDPKGSLPRQRSLGGKREDYTPPSVAMVSPMPMASHNNNHNNIISSNYNNNQVSASESGSALSEASHNSSHSNSNSSGSSVIYKPTSSEEDENSMENLIKKDVGDKVIRTDDGDDVILDIKPMQPLVRAAQYGYMRGISSPIQNARTISPSLHVSRLALQDTSNTVPQKGMRFAPPHLRRQIANGSPKMQVGQFIDGDYSDIESIDLANGYMSDGDVLRQNVGFKTYPGGGELDGYLSEGGASLYAQRLNQRFKEGIRQVHESMNKVQLFMQDDSFDDSSSLSSGVSDTLNELSEDLLSTSLSSEHTNALAKARGHKDVGLKLPVGLSGNSPRKAVLGMDPSGVYKVVSSRAHVKRAEISQASENPAFKQISNTQWKKYVEGNKVACDGNRYGDVNGSISSKKQEQKRNNLGSPLIPNTLGFLSHSPGIQHVSSSKKHDRRGSGGSEKKDHREKTGSPLSPQVNPDSKKLANVRPGANVSMYNGKKVSSSSNAKIGGKTKQDSESNSSSHSLDRPKTRVKVSGGTQTTSDLQFMPAVGFHSDGEYSSNSLGRKYQQMKSYSLNGPAAAQLSQGVRERILQSPYRKVHMGGGPGGSELAAYAQGLYRERSPRLKPTDGSLSDSPYSNYAEMQYGGVQYGSPYSWVSRGPYASSVASAPTRSTKSEKIIGLRDGYNSSQPTSPTPPPSNRMPVSPLNTATRGSPYYSSFNSRTSKDDDCHGSSLSLVSSSSSIYSSQEDKHTSEMRRLRKDLIDAQGKVVTLTNQLTTNAHVVAAFEQSLTNMTNRLQKLAATSEQKDSELVELRKTIDALRQQSIDAGLTVACLQSMSDNGSPLHKNPSNRAQVVATTASPLAAVVTTASASLAFTPAAVVSSNSTITSSSPNSPNKPPPHPFSPTNMSSSVLQVCQPRSRPTSPAAGKSSSTPDYARRHTFTGACRDLVACNGTAGTPPNGGNLVRGNSVESVSSLSSACSATSHTSGHDKSDASKSAKKKGWLRSSFTKAFSRGSKGKKHLEISSDAEELRGEKLDFSSLPSSPLPNRGLPDQQQEEDPCSEPTEEDREDVERLKRQLWEKDMALTDIRLDALSSAHQLDSLKEKMTKMRFEMRSLKDDNERLQRMMSSKSLNSSQSSVSVPEPSADQRLSLTEVITLEDTTDVLLIDPLDKDGKKVSISVLMGCHGDYEKYLYPVDGSYVSECVIGAISLSGRTKWDTLDSLVRRIFKEYLMRVDPVSNLGISSDSILSYHLGEVSRRKDSPLPELLPCGYLVGEVKNVRVVLKGASINCVDALVFETLVPKSIVQRYVSLLSEHRRIILCGPSGTGKTYLAQKLAEFLVCRLGKDPSPGNIATFGVDHKTGKDLGAYLSHISEQCESNVSELPLVIILDNLHYAGALTEVFNGFLSAKYTQSPFIIGTMSQTTSCSTTNLQLHHNFRWVLMANHMEPVKGLLARISRRKLTQVEVETCTRQPRLQQILDWLPKCWFHINKFLETHSSSDVTIGPRLFLSCPGSIDSSQTWFWELWNYSLIPYMMEAVKEGLQLYGKRSSWEDPASWIMDTYPWPVGQHNKVPSLVSLRPEDVGYDSVSNSTSNTPEKSNEANGDSDPLLSMLMRLQEAANFSSPQQDTATVSLENMESALESTL